MSLLQSMRGSSRLGITVAAAAATVGVLYGYDTSNIGAALDFITKDFHLNPIQQGSVTGFVIVGEIVGALSGGWLANRFGRKTTMVGVAVAFSLFSLMSGLAWSVDSLAVARVLLGLSIGVAIVVAPMFLAESAAPDIRGAMLVLYQVATVIGVILGYLLGMALAPTENWRWMLGIAAIPGAIITVVIWRLPDTATWYLMKGRRDEAAHVLAQMNPGVDSAAELQTMSREIAELTDGTPATDRLKAMFRRPYVRATVFVIVLGFFVQITGINAIVYYSPQIFKAMGVNPTDYTLQFGLSALVQFASLIAVFISMSLVDRMGRRPILMTGIGIMVLANILLIIVFRIGAGGVTNLSDVHLSSGWIALGFIGLVLFTMGFTFGFGAMVWVFAGESFPTHLRGMGASAMLTADLVANWIVAQLFPPLLNRAGGVGVFVIFGILALLSLAFVAKYAPETTGRRLDAIRYYWENGAKWPEETTPPTSHG